MRDVRDYIITSEGYLLETVKGDPMCVCEHRWSAHHGACGSCPCRAYKEEVSVRALANGKEGKVPGWTCPNCGEDTTPLKTANGNGWCSNCGWVRYAENLPEETVREVRLLDRYKER